MGSSVFIKQLVFFICIKSKELEAQDISRMMHICSFKIRDKLEDPKNTIMLLLQELMKKLGGIDEKALPNTFPVLTYWGIGNKHYYELLGIQWVKFMKNFDEHTTTKIIKFAAEGSLSTKTLISSLNKAIKQLVLNISPIIYDISDSKLEAPIGLFNKDDAIDMALKALQQEITGSQIVKKSEKADVMSIDEIYQTNNHPFFKVFRFIDFAWAYISIVHRHDIGMLDTDTWGLIIQLLNKHISNLVKTDKRLSYVDYEQLSQIDYISRTSLPTLTKVDIPKTIYDYTLHTDARYYQNPISNRITTNIEFEDQFAAYCQENGILYHLPKRHSAKVFDQTLLIGNSRLIANANTNYPVIVHRQADYFEEGNLRGLPSTREKLVQELTKFHIVSYLEWFNAGKSRAYFTKITK